MKIFTKTLLILSLFIAVSAHSQTTKKTATPVKKTVAKKPAATKDNAAKAAARARAKEDSVAAVNALAMQMARKIVMEDSIKKARAAEQLAMEEKLREEQLKADQAKAEQGKKKPEKTAKTKQEKVKPEKKEAAVKAKPEKTVKEPVKKVPDELRPTAKPEVASSDAKTWIGLRGMGIGSFLTGKDVTSEFKPLIGYGGGLVANFGLGIHFSFQPEVLYAQEGFKIDGELAGETYKGSVTANVVQVPLLLKYSFGEYNKGFFVNVGPYGNYLINVVSNDKTFGTGKTTTKPDKTTIEYGVSGGLGVAVPVGRGRLLVETRGTFYLGSTEKDDEPSDARIVTGALSIGYLFPIGR